MNACSSLCPQGPCAGCVTPENLFAPLPLDVARCRPSTWCEKRSACARATDWPRTRNHMTIVDASVVANDETGCPMFLEAPAMKAHA